MEILHILFFSLAFKGFSKAAGILPDGPLNASVGSNVIFNRLLNEGDGQITFLIWSFDRFGGRNILTYQPPTVVFNPLYANRAVFDSSTGSLELMNVTLEDRGGYGIQLNNALFPDPVNPAVDDVNVDVYERISSVAIIPQNTDLVEFNNSLSLTCSSSGSPLSFLWMNSSSVITASDRVQITGSTLTVVNVTRYDDQSYSCQASNPVSDGTSDPVKIHVSYGPENTKMNLSLSQEFISENSNLVLTCSADSKPSASLTWFVNETKLPDTGPDLTLMNIQMDQSGSYSCQAFNSKTLRYETSQPSSVSVLKKISGVLIKAPPDQIIEGNSVNLSCEASGSSPSTKWKKNDLDLTESDNIILSDNNQVLTFKAINKHNTGEYVCVVSNPVSSNEARYTLTVNYGPENVHVSGETEILTNGQIELICVAESTPFATFTWKLNGSIILQNSDVFAKEAATSSDSGNYICEAWNQVTDKRVTAEHELRVEGNLATSSGCSAGCIAGIVLGCLVVIALGSVGGYFLYRSKSRKSSSSRNNNNTTARGRQDNASYSGEEVNYADLKFAKKKKKATVVTVSENAASNYAEIKVNNRPQAPSPPNYDMHIQRVNEAAAGADDFTQRNRAH